MSTFANSYMRTYVPIPCLIERNLSVNTAIYPPFLMAILIPIQESFFPLIQGYRKLNLRLHQIKKEWLAAIMNETQGTSSIPCE